MMRVGPSSCEHEDVWAFPPTFPTDFFHRRLIPPASLSNVIWLRLGMRNSLRLPSCPFFG